MELAPSTGHSQELIGLVDGHSYYCSCHRVFEPKLIGRPLVVLSNNDSAAVSRTDEAKALGVKMGQPRHELEWFVRNKGLILRSSNYPLYQDMHRRMITAIRDIVPAHPASIDEAFILLTGMKGDMQELGVKLQRHVLKMVGIPCGVGISRNCTTAKLTNWASKKWKRQTGSVVAVLEYERLRKLMAHADVGDVWGIGSRLKEHLNSYGITTALQLADANSSHMRRLHGVQLMRTIEELNFKFAINPDDDVLPRKSMTVSRTYPSPVDHFEQLRESITTYAALIGRKLRRDRLLANCLRVYIQPSRQSIMVRPRSVTFGLVSPTNDSRELIAASQRGLMQCFIEGQSWIKVGVMVVDAVPEDGFTPDLFAPQSSPRSRDLMAVMDRINNLSGSGTVRFASEQKSIGDVLRSNFRTPKYTTSWDDILKIG